MKQKKKGSYPFQYERTKKISYRKKKNKVQNKNEQNISNYTNNIIIIGLAICLNSNKYTHYCSLLNYFNDENVDTVFEGV
jgi:hypothetical protein